MIYYVTLNPALDQIIEVEDKIRPGNNNLIRKSTIDVSGKGTHVSIALSLLEEKSVCTGISGEIYYNELQDNLKEFGVEGDFVTIHNQAVRKNLILM
ncbi:hypothetical protein [Aerococcus urinaeequi]|uniref:hypothetical protein n=1 Tax=Aerococcus urinaeequi TaxID=51665 RepID=UPI000845CE14|nr:hypothetical protein [Aerococcus urinaeequi]